MKVLIYDPFAGISGDMNLGAMIDLGVDPDALKAELAKLQLDGYELKITRDQRKGISGTRVDVILNHDQHHHRHLRDINKIITGCGLTHGVVNKSLAMFRRLAEAEAKIHDKKVDQVHFHEVGAIDSIVDIVGAAICLELLAPDKIISTTVELGGGFVECAHGTFPVPAPATAEILKNIPVSSGATRMEMTTPTGALILACNADTFGPLQNLRLLQTAYGIGQRDPEIPNVLRVYWAEEEPKGDTDMVQMDSAPEQFGTDPEQDDNGPERNDALMIETNIDDMNPEWYTHIMDRLFDLGADDVFLTPIIMKKARPASMLSVLCSREKEAEITAFLLTETSSLGLRKYPVMKEMLQRTYRTLDTRYGKVGIKTAFYQGKELKSKPEYDDCQRLASENKVPIRLIYEEIGRIIEKQDLDRR